MMSAPAAAYAAGSAPATAWETEPGSSVIYNDTAWLLSFIDILTLLLTLFVLLLAYDRYEQLPGDLSWQAPPQQAAEAGVHVPLPEAGEPGYPLAIPLTISDWFSLLDPRTMARAASVEELAGAVTEADAPSDPGASVPEQESVVAAQPVVAQTIDRPSTTSNDTPPLAPETPTAPLATSSPLPDSDPLAMSPLPDPVTNQADATAGLLPMVQPASTQIPVDSVPGQEATAANALLHNISDTLRDRIEVTVATGMVNLEISDNILFRLASAALTRDGYAVLDELASVLKDQPYVLSVEGHTDNIPIETALFPSNWELSSARAAIVTRSLIERGIAADRIRAIGYGDTRPRADNQSAEGRARNRRVSFVLHVE